MTTTNESDSSEEGLQDPAEMSFETAIEELEASVEKLEDGTLTLEQQVTFYERGMKLVEACRDKLNAAAARIEQVVSAEDGESVVEPFDGPEQDA